MATERRCRNQSCREWYDAKAHACPSCGVERYGVNKWLVTAEMNNALYAQAERAERER